MNFLFLLLAFALKVHSQADVYYELTYDYDLVSHEAKAEVGIFTDIGCATLCTEKRECASFVMNSGSCKTIPYPQTVVNASRNESSPKNFIRIQNESSVDSCSEIRYGQVMSSLTAVTCKRRWTGFDGWCYMLVPTNATFWTAKDLCANLLANLSSIHTAESNEFIAGFVGDAKPWIGLNIVSKFRSAWTDGSFFDFANFPPQQASAPGSCVTITATGLWEVTGCNASQPALCKMPAT